MVAPSAVLSAMRKDGKRGGFSALAMFVSSKVIESDPCKHPFRLHQKKTNGDFLEPWRDASVRLG